ncbi:MAG: hypothetical protein AABY22_28145 [Nanoarchaeota archaeon]
MKLIRFRRLNKTNWETALNQEDLNRKLDGKFAEIIMPAKSLLIRFWLQIKNCFFLFDKNKNSK